MLSIAATPTPFRITYRSRGPVSIENRTCRKLKCSMHLTGAHVFTDGQPFTLTASISPLTVYAVFQDTRDPSPRSSPRFVRPRRRGDGQRTVEQAFCNVTSFPSPFVQGIARSSHDHRPNSVDRDLDLETVAERVSPVDASLYIRGTEQRGFLAC